MRRARWSRILLGKLCFEGKIGVFKVNQGHRNVVGSKCEEADEDMVTGGEQSAH